MDFWMKLRARTGTGYTIALGAAWTPLHPPHSPVLQRGCYKYASAASLNRTGVGQNSHSQEAVKGRAMMHVPARLGHSREPTVFWGSKEPGPGELRFAEPPKGLILMGVWCVRKERHHPTKTRARRRQPANVRGQTTT